MRLESDLNIEVIRKNLAQIKEDIKQYSPYPERVKLVAVTKYFDQSGIEAILEAGHNIIGENKGQEMRDKGRYFKESFPEKYSNIRWHFIGNLQKNKVKYIVDSVELIHSINRLSVAQEVDKRAKESGRVIDILIEINVSGEESKEGYILEQFLEEIPEYMNLKNLNIVGLMTMAPNTEVDEVLRSTFSKLREIKDRLNRESFSNRLTELSMGMSGDYKIALEEGSTLVRIGTKLFE